MNEWIKNLVGYLMIVSVVTQMLPSEQYKQYVRLFTGCLLIVLVLRPVLKIDTAEQYLENRIVEFVREQEELENQIGMQSEKLWQKDEHEIEIEKIREVQVEVDPDD